MRTKAAAVAAAPLTPDPVVWVYSTGTASQIFKHRIKHHFILLFDSRDAELKSETAKARATLAFRAADAVATGSQTVLYIEVDLAANGDATQQAKRAKLASFLGAGEEKLLAAIVAMGSAKMEVHRYHGAWRKPELVAFEENYHAGKLAPLQRGNARKEETKDQQRMEEKKERGEQKSLLR